MNKIKKGENLLPGFSIVSETVSKNTNLKTKGIQNTKGAGSLTKPAKQKNICQLLGAFVFLRNYFVIPRQLFIVYLHFEKFAAQKNFIFT